MCFSAIFDDTVPVFVRIGSMTPDFVTLDAFDRKLLARARINNLEPARITAEAVGLSESAVLRRLRRLRAEGVIARDIAIVDADRIAPRIVLHVLVKMASQDRKAADAFKAAMKASPEVQAAWDVTGEWSFLLYLVVPSMRDYEVFGERELTTEAHVSQFQSMITIREVVAFDPSRQALA
ncbi:MAG: Lrp/AsnC family transcriptional regulator [Caulobacterales bacterium]|nr:Lrp/AsnC family transcriptional regulator [Caulobacterales bacterium]